MKDSKKKELKSSKTKIDLISIQEEVLKETEMKDLLGGTGDCRNCIDSSNGNNQKSAARTRDW